jgi:thymidylate synthase ThyX
MSIPLEFVDPLDYMRSTLKEDQDKGLLVTTDQMAEALTPVEVIVPSVEIIGEHDGEYIMRHLEAAIRTAYKSEDKIGPGSAEKILAHILSLKHESTLEHHSISFRIVTSRGVTHELVRHRLACLAGDTQIKFDLPAGQKSGRRGYSVRLDVLANRWARGSSATANRKKKSTHEDLVTPDRVYSANELAEITGRRRETINNLVRQGYLTGSVVHDPSVTSPNKRVTQVLGADWISYANKKTTIISPCRERIARMRLRMCDESTGEILSTTIKDIYPSGVKAVYRVTLDNGYAVKMSRDHLVLTSDGWMPLSEAVRMEGERKLATFTPVTGRLFAVNGYAVGSKVNVSGNQRGMALTPDGRNMLRQSKQGAANPQWRGGTTPERAKIGRWTTAQAPALHKASDYTCQLCGGRGGRLHAHHVDPVYHNIHRAYDPTNLLSVHAECHRELESRNLELGLLAAMESGVSPQEFWSAHMGDRPLADASKKAKTTTRLVRDWAAVVSVDYIGDEETFDIEVDGPYHNFVANGFIVHNSYTQESTRYVNYGKHPPQVILPWHLAARGIDDKEFWYDSQRRIIGFYLDALTKKWAPQDARGLLPNDLKTEIVVTMNLRALRNFFTLRTAKSAHPDMQIIAREMFRQVYAIVPLLFKDIAVTNGLLGYAEVS